MSDYYFDDVRTLADHINYLYPDLSRIRLNSTLIMLFVYYHYSIKGGPKPEYLFNGSIVVCNTGSDIKEIKEEFKSHRYSKSEGYEPKRYKFDENSKLDKIICELIEYTYTELEENFTDFELFVKVTDMILYSLDSKEHFNNDKPIPHDLMLESVYDYIKDKNEEE